MTTHANGKRSIPRPPKGTLCVVRGENVFVYRGFEGRDKRVTSYAGQLLQGETVIYVRKQSAHGVTTRYVRLGSTGAFQPFDDIFDDYDWFLSRLGIVLVSRSALSLDT